MKEAEKAYNSGDIATGNQLMHQAASHGTTVETTVVRNSGTNKGTNGQIIKNSDGLNEIKINQTPLKGQNRLNTPDLGGSGKLKPAEAAAAAQLEHALGEMERYTPPSGATQGASPDFVITSGPNKGKTVDALYITDKLSQKK